MLIQQSAPVRTYDNVFSFMLDTVDAYIAAFIDAGVTQMQGTVGLSLASIFGVYVAIYGWMVMYGFAEGNITTIMKKVGKFALVWVIATQGTYYSLFFRDFVWQLPESVAATLLGIVGAADPSVQGNVAGLSTVMETYNDNLNLITKKIAASGKIVPDLLAGLLALIMQIPVIVALFVVLIAKVGLSIMIVLGPLFLIASLFGLTKGLFEGFLRQTMTFVVMAVLAYAVIALLMAMLNEFGTNLSSGRGAIEWVKGIPLALVGLVAAVVFMQVPSFATGIVGGIGLSDLNIIRNTGNNLRDIDRQKGGAGAAGGGGGSRSKAAGARIGRALGRSGGAAANQASSFTRNAVMPRIAKVSPRVHQALSNTAKSVSAGASKTTEVVKTTAQTASYYSGAKGTAKPSPKPKAPEKSAFQKVKPDT